MKSNAFNYSFLAIGVAAVMGITTAASAVQTPTTTTGVNITNQATANYSVSDQPQPEAKSNTVTVSVSQQVSFSLTADNDDTAAPTNGVQGDDKNQNITVTPNGFVLFKHTLKNTGNTTDTYDITLGATNAKYIQNESTVTYTVYEADGITPVAGRTNITVPYTAGGSLPSELTKGQSVKFTIKAKTSGNKGNEILPLELSVTSRNLSQPGSTATIKTLINTDTSFTRLPTFGIVKTITNGLDLNDSTYKDTATYKVVVTNEGTLFSADATNITIEDVLPDGLVMANALTAANITVGTGATKGTIAPGSAGTRGFNITGVDLPVGQSITIIFEVKQTGVVKITPAVAMGMINHVTVTDDLDEDATTTGDIVIDSTKSGSPENVSTFYPTDDVENLNGETPASKGDDSTVPLLTIERKLTLTGSTTKEIAPNTELTSTNTAGQVTHSTVITNTGKDVEGSKSGELTFTITDNDGTTPDAVNVVPGTVKVTYNPNDGTGVQAAKVIGAGTGGIYDINTVLPAGVKAGGTVTITYNVSANKAPLFNPVTSTDDANATFEDTIVTLIPGLEGAPTVDPITDKTTVRGLVLVKKQAKAVDCAATSTGIVGAFAVTDINGAFPGECIIYQIQARNTSTTAAGFPITNVTILDEFSQFSANANYVVGSLTATTDGAGAVDPTENPTGTPTNVTTTVTELAAQKTVTMQFKVKIKTGL